MKFAVEISENGKKTVLNPCEDPCSIERGMRILGGKWKGSILWYLRDGAIRFNDLVRQFPGASRKMIDQRLKEMESMGLVHRQVLSEKPLAVSYDITDFGRSALGVLETLKDWSEEHDL